MAEQIRTDICPNPSCGKGEILRYPNMELDYHEKCPICGEELVIPSDLKKPITVRSFSVVIG